MGELLDKLNAATAGDRYRDPFDNPAFTVMEPEATPLETIFDKDPAQGAKDLLAWVEKARQDPNLHVQPKAFGSFWKMAAHGGVERDALIELELRERNHVIGPEDRKAIEAEIGAAYAAGERAAVLDQFKRQISATPGLLVLDTGDTGWEKGLGLSPKAALASQLTDLGDGIGKEPIDLPPGRAYDKAFVHRCQEAWGDYQRAIAADPTYVRAIWSMQQLTLTCGDKVDYNTTFYQGDHPGGLRDLMKKVPAYADGWRDLATHHYFHGGFDAAREAYARYFALVRPVEPDDYLAYGVALEKTGRIDEAHAAYQDCADRAKVDAYLNSPWSLCTLHQIGLMAPITDLKIDFKPGEAEISKEGRKALDKAARFLKVHPNLERFKIKGHTGQVGDPTARELLSKQRAQAVLDYLVAQGVGPAILASEGVAGRQPRMTEGFQVADAASQEFVSFDLNFDRPAAPTGPSPSNP